MKKEYIAPECELILLNNKDILTKSVEIDGGETETELPDLTI